MWEVLLFFIIIIVLGFGFYLVNISNNKRIQEQTEKAKHKAKIITQKQSLDRNKQEAKALIIKKFSETYGEISTSFKLRHNFSFYSAYVFEKSEILVVLHPNNKYDILPFNAIIDFEGIREEEVTGEGSMTTITKTSTGSMIGRGLAGGLLFGGIGAGIGAATAKKESETTINDPTISYFYTISLTLDSLSNPLYELSFGPEKAWFKEALSIISVIMKRKGEGKYTNSNISLSIETNARSEFDNRDPLFEEVARLIVTYDVASTSSLQRRFSIGYYRAGKIMEELEAAGIVGPANGGKPRDVLVDLVELEEILSNPNS